MGEGDQGRRRAGDEIAAFDFGRDVSRTNGRPSPLVGAISRGISFQQVVEFF